MGSRIAPQRLMAWNQAPGEPAVEKVGYGGHHEGPERPALQRELGCGSQPVAQKGRAGEAEEREQRQQQTQTGEKIGKAFHVDHRNAHRAIVSPVGLPEKLPE